MKEGMIHNDAVIFGMLMLVLGFVFHTSSSPRLFWKKFYGWVPTVLVCYFLPSLLFSFGVVDPTESNLYFMASRYLLPTSLVLLTISVDLKELVKLGPKALIMFLTGSVGIILGGPIALLFISFVAPGVIEAPPTEEIWRGMTTIAGSWIGGSANQAAMKEVFNVSGGLFSKMVAVDIIMGNLWLAVVMFGIGKNKQINQILKADDTAIEELKIKMATFQEKSSRIPSLGDLIKILAIGFGCTGVAHFFSDLISPFLSENYPQLEDYSLTSGFFWIVVIAATLGVGLSFTKVRSLESAGASNLGTIFVYVLVAVIGMNMNIMAVFENPGLFLIGFIWISFHALLLVIVAKIIRAPYFFVAVGSQANVGGAASAPIVAAYFSPSLAPVGVLLAVFGYVVGTYGAYLCGLLLQGVSP
ncbi:MAG: DUF819 family protein [Flammeovirgaceae bacterium]|jgi:uncharacterized membrane protein|nr:DUF819 family protein [Flammeovirgaceae bacterium]|tara:strand:- start:6000 stop:7244 length:1245 start_codon:yes stop_codon:yes gene_type:complete